MTEVERILGKDCQNFVELTKRKNGTLSYATAKAFIGSITPNHWYEYEGNVYFFVDSDGVIIKIGRTDRTMVQRTSDYNKKRNGAGTERRLMDLVFSDNRKIRMYVVPVEGTVNHNGKERKMNSTILEQFYLQDYVQEFGRLPKLNFAHK